MNGKIGLITMPGVEPFSSKVDYYLKLWHNTEESFFVNAIFPRFASGDAKVVLEDSVRGKDVYIISDPYNYSVKYKMRGFETNMSPDDHFQNIKRVLSAINGKAKRISVMMTMLYESRQHSRSSRESLDCAVALRELEYLGVDNIITFDAHDPKVQNAIPMISFDNLYPNYQMIKAFLRSVKNISFCPSDLVIISPDAGGVQRCLKFAEALSLDIGMFYKRRDLNCLVDGTNPIVRHEYMGTGIDGKDCIIVDDVLSTGDSLLDTFNELKKQNARRIFAFITFGLFTKGYQSFDKAYENGFFDNIFISNLTYRDQIEIERPWLVDVDLSKYASYIIESINKDVSISAVLDPRIKIKALVNNYMKNMI